MYIVRFKNLNSQAALGQGYVGGSSAQATGATNTRGLYYGNTTSSTDRVKCFGIEDLWGNIWEWIEGLMTNATPAILTAFTNFNNSGSGYANRGNINTTNASGFIVTTVGTSESGFIPKTATGSTSTYYADKSLIYASCPGMFGGFSNLECGVFGLGIYRDFSSVYTNITARLMYL